METTEVKETVEVNPGEFRKEWHNYNRTMIVIAATCLIAFIGSWIAMSQWQARTDERITSQGERIAAHDKQIETLNTFQAQINGRLGVIEERTSNTVKGIERIENKLDNVKK